MDRAHVEKISKALADKTRLRIFEAISASKHMTCGEIVSMRGVTPATVSHHLKILRVGCDGFGDGLAIDELPFAPAVDQPSLAQSFEMVRDGCGGHDAHQDDLATGHVVACRE